MRQTLCSPQRTGTIKTLRGLNLSAYDLWDTFLPAFKELVTKADVAGVMCVLIMP